MGKLKRARQKFHLSRTKAVENTNNDPTNFESGTSNFLTLKPLPENIFSGLEISAEDLKQKLPESDVISIVSNRKDVFKPISKKEKIKLRHEMFMKKLEVVNHMRKEAKHKKKNPKRKAKDGTHNKIPLLDSLPPLEILSKNKEVINKVKKRSVPKMKHRQKIMLQDISVFKTIIADPLYRADPTGTITSHIQEKMLHETE